MDKRSAPTSLPHFTESHSPDPVHTVQRPTSVQFPGQGSSVP